jgi:hypothetical protein
LGEANDEIHLCKDRIDGEIDIELLMKFVEAPTNRIGVRGDLCRLSVASASSIFSFRTGASLSSAAGSVIACAIFAAARRRATTRQAIEPATTRRIRAMTRSRVRTPSKGCASPM